MKKLILFLIILILSSCSSVNTPDIEIKNNLVYQDGFELSYTNFKHKFILNVQTDKDYIINRINYKLSVPNFKEIWGTYIPQKMLYIRGNQDDFQEIKILSEETSYFDLCEQMNAIFSGKDASFSMKMDLEIITSKNKIISVQNIDVMVRNVTLWDGIRNFVIENGCKVTTLPGFVNLLKTLIGE